MCIARRRRALAGGASRLDEVLAVGSEVSCKPRDAPHTAIHRERNEMLGACPLYRRQCRGDATLSAAALRVAFHVHRPANDMTCQRVDETAAVPRLCGNFTQLIHVLLVKTPNIRGGTGRDALAGIPRGECCATAGGLE